MSIVHQVPDFVNSNYRRFSRYEYVMTDVCSFVCVLVRWFVSGITQKVAGGLDLVQVGGGCILLVNGAATWRIQEK